MRDADPDAVMAALAEPFAIDEVKFRPQNVRNNRALALAYIDGRLVSDRLDRVLGIDGWKDAYELLPDNSVICKLRLRIGPRWVTKVDVGSPSEQPDGGDRMKAAFSDALKRAAVKFGVGRYLYRLPAMWADYDPVKKQFASPPKLPAFALPSPRPKAIAAPAKPDPSQAPRDGAELLARVALFDAKLAGEGMHTAGELVARLGQWGARAGHGQDATRWPPEVVAQAVERVKQYAAGLKPQLPDRHQEDAP